MHAYRSCLGTALKNILVSLWPLLACADDRPWLKEAFPRQEFHIGSDAAGVGTADDPMSLHDAISASRPGDLFWLRAGSYRAGTLKIRNSGTENDPIIFRGVPGDRVTIVGRFSITASHVWLWNLEITDPDRASEVSSGVDVLGSHVSLINCVIHDIGINNGIGAWNTGPGQIFYGNILYNNGVGWTDRMPAPPHSIYAQNDVEKYGHKLFVQNLLLDQEMVHRGNTFNFHGYAENNSISGFFFGQNVVRDGRFLIGGRVPSSYNIVRQNYFYKAGPSFGHARPVQVDFSDNYVARAGITIMHYWGHSDEASKPDSITVTNNEIHLPPDGYHVKFRTATIKDNRVVVGAAGIDAKDLWDRNTYSYPFKGFFSANGKTDDSASLVQWRMLTSQAGAAFDGEAGELAAPPPNTVFILTNDYDSSRGLLVVFNWLRLNADLIDLSAAVPGGSQYRLLEPRNLWGTPVLEGSYDGPVSVPLGGSEFVVYVIQTWPGR